MPDEESHLSPAAMDTTPGSECSHATFSTVTICSGQLYPLTGFNLGCGDVEWDATNLSRPSAAEDCYYTQSH